ncbi:DUF1430 domain-containing protein [Clostridium sp.]|uniref:DUF1430 domain-containing protein n=1 Tax=Clostridium sp. TaxID=1506 RepID=UPI002FDD8669
MKKIIVILLIIISMFSFFILFKDESLKQSNNMEKVEQTLDNSFEILLPSSLGSGSQTDIYNKIVSVLNKHNANIYFSRVGDNDEIIKYIYFNNLAYFNNFLVTNGRIFDLSENESNKFLSTKNTGNSKQIGKLGSFDGKTDFEINTLKSMIDTNEFLIIGNCTVQLAPKDKIDLFIQDLKESLKTDEIVVEPKNNLTISYHYNKWIIPVLYFIIVVLILYSILKSYKKFGVQMLLGYSKKDIWLEAISNLLLIQCITIIATDLIMSLYLFREYNSYFINFLKIILINNIELVVVFFVISSLPFIYVYNIKIIHMLKNKLPVKEIIVFNSFIKVVTILLLFNLMNQGLQNYDRIKSVFNNNYKKWAETKKYYVIPSIRSTNGRIENESKLNELQVPLYYNINKEGAIWADFLGYSPILHGAESIKPAYAKMYVTVNPNYLKKNILYDVHNNLISISETESDFILLVPDKFKEFESKIIDSAKHRKKGYGKGSITEKQEIKIIYTKSNQKLFSYRFDVNPTDGNMVTDPIIRVMTEKNGVTWDFQRIIGETGTPIKINVDSAPDPQKFLEDKFKKFELYEYVYSFVRADEGKAFESKEVYNLLAFIIGGLAVLIIVMLITIIQNIYCFFEQYKKQLAIRQFHGYRAGSKYKELFILFLITWSTAFIIELCMADLHIKVQFILTIFFMAIDLLITMITIKFVNKRKIISVIKGS